MIHDRREGWVLEDFFLGVSLTDAASSVETVASFS